MPPLLEIRDLVKSFSGVRVLDAVALRLESGQTLGLVGENGAGKSTLVNVLGGVHAPDSGIVLLAGAAHAPRDPAEAARAGVALVHQELNLFPNLSVAENLFLTDFPRAAPGWIARGRLRERARAALAAVELAADPDTSVGELSPGERQLVEIARALALRARVVVFDEPTTSLTARERERLFALIGRLRAEGVGVIYVSHNLGDVLRLCDEVLVLRDGRAVASGPARDFPVPRLITLMIGRDLEQVFPPRRGAPSGEVVLEAKGLARAGALDGVGFALHAGEVLGLAGLMGAGRTELARAVFGLDPLDAGEVYLKGEPLHGCSPAARVRRGLAFLTEDRREEGLLLEASALENIALASLPRLGRGPLGWLDRGSLRESAEGLAKSLRLDCPDLGRGAVRTLSGGNQQKVVFARWLLGGRSAFLLDEPTRGVDVGARVEIYQTIHALAERGAGVLLISSEVEELLGLCDRILVMARGRITGSFARPGFDREAVLRAALGEDRLQ